MSKKNLKSGTLTLEVRCIKLEVFWGVVYVCEGVGGLKDRLLSPLNYFYIFNDCRGCSL